MAVLVRRVGLFLLLAFLQLSRAEATQVIHGVTPDGALYAFALPQALNAIGFNLRFTNDLLDRTAGHAFYDNTSTIYPAAVDGLVGRFSASKQGLRYFDRHYRPSGDHVFPLLTLHTTRDAIVPLMHQSLYGTQARPQWLVQQTADRAGHCAFTPQEVLASFDDLVRWVTDDTRPGGGDVTAR